MSRMTFTYDEDTLTRPSDWFAAPYAEGAAAVPVKGNLVLPAAEFSCQRQPDNLQSLAVPVIVLARRGECSFNKKVMNLKHISNLTGVIIYNDREEEDLSNIYVDKTSLPVIFTSLTIGQNLAEIIRNGGKVNVTVSVDSVCQMNSDSSKFQCVRTVTQWDIVCIAVAFSILAVVTFTSAVLYYLKKLTQAEKLERYERKREILTRQALAHLEVFRLEDGESARSEECAVCLEVIKLDQQMRRLPCSHAYHRECIDSWLLKKRKCPLCKLDILQYFREFLRDSSID